jgi:hypothetical protein
MPVNIPAGTKFEAIKPTTVVNRRSALVNSNDQTFTIEDFVQTVGGGFTITNNYIPRGNASGSIVDSNLSEIVYGINDRSLTGNYDGGLVFTYQSSSNLLNIYGETGNTNAYAKIGDVYGNSGPSWGINMDGSVAFPYLQINLAGTSVLFFDYISAAYSFGGATTKFGIINADLAQASLSVSADLVTNVSGTDYIKVDVNGTPYKIQLIP